jgi:hypothetical protein
MLFLTANARLFQLQTTACELFYDTLTFDAKLPIYVLKKQLSHSDIITTEMYPQVTQGDAVNNISTMRRA